MRSRKNISRVFPAPIPANSKMSHTQKNMPLGHVDPFQYLKVSDPIIPDIRRLIKNSVEKSLRAK